MSRSVVVLVSGGAAVTPYTTPSAAARRGQAAGNTMTALRERLLAAGREVYTAPARIGVGEVREDTGWEGFGDVPEVLPAALTINAVGEIDAAGASLAAFLGHLEAERDVAAFDLVGHSMGGLFSRAAIRARRGRAGGAPVRRLVTLGTPWTSSVLGDVVTGDLTLADAQGDPGTLAIMAEVAPYAAEYSEGAAAQVGRRYLAGPDGWNARQAGALDGVDVTLIAGTYFDAASEPELLWPHDALVPRGSALASRVPARVLPSAARAEFRDVHSIYFADRFGLPWERALTWDPEVLDFVAVSLDPLAPSR